MSLVTVFAAESKSECKDKGLAFYADLGNGDYICTNSTTDILNGIKPNKSAYVTVMNDFDATDKVTLNKDVTYDLNGYTVTFKSSGQYTVEGAEVTFKNGNVVVDSTASENVFNVKSDTAASKLTLNVTVESAVNKTVVKVSDATKATEVNINGTWEVAGELVDCDNGVKKNLTVNLNANVTGEDLTDALVSIDAGTTVVNVKGGSYTSNAKVFYLQNGTLNIEKGTIKSEEDSAIVVDGAASGYKTTLKITGGNISTEKGYAIWFGAGSSAKTGTYSIANATLTSGENEDDEQLPALMIDDPEFLDNHKAMVTSGTFKGALVGDVKVGTKVYKTSAAATAILVGNATDSHPLFY